MSFSNNYIAKYQVVLYFLMSTFMYGQTDLQFVDFEMSDTVTIGSTVELTGTLYNAGTTIIPANMGMEVVTKPATSSLPSEAYSDSDFTAAFYNPVLNPGDSYSFSRQIWVDPQYFTANQNSVIIIWPIEGITAPDMDTLNNIYTDTIMVKDYRVRLEDYNRQAEPVIMKGEALANDLTDIPIDEIVGFRFKNDKWIQIPIQIDEMVELDVASPYPPYASLVYGVPPSTNKMALFYTDMSTIIGADTNTAFDADDELVFMAKDAGLIAHTNTDPNGVLLGTGIEVAVFDPLDFTTGYIYLYQQDGSLPQSAGKTYVNYEYNPFLVPIGGENSTVNTTYYSWHFSDTWLSDELKFNSPEGSNENILDQHVTFFGPDICGQNETTFSTGTNVYITNKSGPVRAIRSYMGANEQYFTQRTHFFYEAKQDIITDIRMEGMLYYFDFFNYNENTIGMNYVSNSFIDGLVIDGNAEDFATDTPAQWEMVTGDQGTLFVIHDVQIQDTIQDLEGAIGNYWSDNAQNPTYNCSGTSNEYGSSGIVINISDLCTKPESISCNPNNSLQMKRTVYFADPNLEVLDAFIHQQYSKVALETTHVPYVLPCYRVELAAWLEGSYKNGIGSMDTGLQSRGLLPGQTPLNPMVATTPAGQPYNTSPWNYSGEQGNNFTDTDYMSRDVDWMLIYLQSPNRFTLSKTTGIMTQSGTIRFADTCPLERISGLDNFNIILEHRNHAGITTVNTVEIINNTLTFDFRNPPPNDVTPSNYGYKEIQPNVWGMYAGDANKTPAANGYDINAGDKAGWLDNNGTYDQYLNTDLNLNGTVDGADKLLWDLNNGIFVPIQN